MHAAIKASQKREKIASGGSFMATDAEDADWVGMGRRTDGRNERDERERSPVGRPRKGAIRVEDR